MTHLQFSADGRELVSYGRGATRRWDARTGRPVRPSAPDIPAPWGVLGPGFNWSGPTGDGTALVAVQLTEKPPYRLVVRRYDLGTGRHEDLFDLPKRKNPESRYAASYALSPDGAMLAQGDDGTVTVWNLRTRTPRHTFDLPGERSFVAQFTQDAAHLLTTEQGSRTVRFWDTRTGAQARSLTRPGGRLPQSGLGCLAVSPDGRRAAAVDNSHLIDHGTELTVWDLDRPDRPQVLNLERGFGPGTLAFAPDGTLYTIGDPDFGGRTVVGRWDVGGGRLLTEWEGPGLNRKRLIANVSPDGTAVAVGTSEGVIALYDARTGAVTAPGGFHAAGVTGVSFDPTGRTVRTAAEDGSAADWTARTGEAVGRYPPAPLDPTERSIDAVASPDGRWVLTQRTTADRSSPRQAATLHDPAAGGRGIDWEVAGRVVALDPVPGGGRLVCRYAAADKHWVQVRDAATGTIAATIDRAFHPDRTRYAVTPDGRSLVACDQESVTGYDLGSGRERFAWRLADRGVVGPAVPTEGPPAPVWAIAASPDGRTLAVSVGGTAYVDPTKRAYQLVLVEMETGAVVRRTRTPETAAGWLAFSPDGRRLAGPRCVWEVGTLAEVRRFPARPAATAARFSPDSRRVATGHANGTAAVWPLDAD